MILCPKPTTRARWRAACILVAVLCAVSVGAAVEATLEAPASAPAGSTLRVQWTGPHNPYDTIVIVPAGAAERTRPTLTSEYTNDKSVPVGIVVPDQAGEYEVRYLDGTTLATLTNRRLSVSRVSATLSAPATVVMGQAVPVTFVGPNNQHDKIAIVPRDAPERAAPKSRQTTYTNREGKVYVSAPDRAGAYELRYLTAQTGSTLGRAALTVVPASTTLTAPDTAPAGTSIEVKWQGPDNPYDKIIIVPAGTPEQRGVDSRFSSYPEHSGVTRVRAPDRVGAYEIRYVTAQGMITLARAPLTLTLVTAALQAAPSVTAGSAFAVIWRGPGSAYDHVAMAPLGESDDLDGAVAYVGRRSPVSLRAPLQPGDYELRYRTGQGHAILATARVQVLPAPAEPGLLRVSAELPGSVSPDLATSGSALEVILEASGSRLQGVGSERRIDITKRALSGLLSIIPPGMPFALRVFGRQERSCRTDLDIPLRPLAPGAAAARIDALYAGADGKAPIALSLEKVASDLGSVKGERVVVLVVDGEETCDGDPAAAIARLTRGRANVRVNIVGLAVDDAVLRATFRHWSRAGNGAYFEARDAAGLQRALARALSPSFEVLDASGQVVLSGVANGEAVPLLPAPYTVRRAGTKGRARPVTIRSRETATLEL